MARQQKTSVDFASILGIVVALGGILGGLVLENGNLRDVAQFTAALIVFCGTAGAVLVTTPKHLVGRALRELKQVFFEQKSSHEARIEELISFVTAARARGLVALEDQVGSVRDRFLKKALNMAVDGLTSEGVIVAMELDMEQCEARAEEAAKVFESGGGYAPTIGIIGAVLGLIQVMKNLGNIQEVGHGIAVAFVATVYGVGLANLFLIPIAGKIRHRAAAVRHLQELTLAGVVAILEGSNPQLLRTKLSAYLDENVRPNSRARLTRAA